jgi:sugar-phosphatase
MSPALIFDYDGLIVDSETMVAEVLRDVLARWEVPLDAQTIGELIGVSPPENNRLWEHVVKQSLGPDADLEAINARVSERIEARLEGLPLLPGVRELADSARGAGWRCAIATGKPRQALTTELDRLGVRDQFDVIVTAEDVVVGKPQPDVYIEAARLLRVAPASCVVLEDSVAGTRAALTAGMTVIVCPCAATRDCTFPNGVRRVESLLDVTVESLTQVT